MGGEGRRGEGKGIGGQGSRDGLVRPSMAD